MSWKKSEKLVDNIKHYSGFPATGVSLRQMVQFGERPSTGTKDPNPQLGKQRAKGAITRHPLPRFPVSL